jgi:hypothetical protein
MKKNLYNYKFNLEMRSIIFSICILFSSTALFAQTVSTDYFLQNSQTRSSMNPAFRPKQGYLGVPFLSDIGIGVYTNAFHLNNFVFERNGEHVTFMHPSVSSADFLSNIPDHSYLDANFNYKLFTLGFYDKKNGFWTFDLGTRVISHGNVPKSLFELLKVGFSQDENKAIAYSIQNLRVSATGYAEAGIGYSKGLLDNQLLIGAKLKLLVGIGNLDLNVERLDISTSNEEWIARSKATLEGSLSGLRPKYNKDNMFESVDFDKDAISPSGYGAGLDLGVAYRFLDNRMNVSLAFTDIGFIAWSKNSSMILKSPETEVRITPGEVSIESDGMNEQLTSIKNDLQETLNFKDNKPSERNTFLRRNMNVGLSYEVWKENLSIGLLSSTYVSPSHTMTEFTVSANYNPATINWFSAALSYSAIHNQFNTVGFALHLTPSKGICFFLGSDFLIPHVNKEFIPTSSKAANFQIGFSIPLGKKRL